MFLHQRFPMYARPLQFLAGAAALLLGLWQGLNWNWDWALQTGNIFIQITIPTKLFVFSDFHAFWLALAGAGLLMVVLFATTSRSNTLRILEAGGPGLWGPRFRFYPLTLFLGLFLAYYGTVFLFNGVIQADNPPGGFVAFVYLNYAGIVGRGVISVFGALVLFAGLTCVTVFAFTPGLGLRQARPAPRASIQATPAAPDPVPLPPVAIDRRPAVVTRVAPRPAPAARTPATRARTTRLSAAGSARTQAP